VINWYTRDKMCTCPPNKLDDWLLSKGHDRGKRKGGKWFLSPRLVNLILTVGLCKKLILNRTNVNRPNGSFSLYIYIYWLLIYILTAYIYIDCLYIYWLLAQYGPNKVLMNKWMNWTNGKWSLIWDVYNTVSIIIYAFILIHLFVSHIQMWYKKKKKIRL